MTNAGNMWEQLRTCKDPRVMDDTWLGVLADALKEDETRLAVRRETAVRWLLMAGKRPAMRDDVSSLPWVFVIEPSRYHPYKPSDGVVYKLYKRFPSGVLPRSVCPRPLYTVCSYKSATAAIDDLAHKLAHLKAVIGIPEHVVPTERPGDVKLFNVPL